MKFKKKKNEKLTGNMKNKFKKFKSNTQKKNVT